MDTEDTGSGKEDEPEQENTSEQEEDDGAGPSTSSGSNSQSSNRHMRNMAEKMRRDKLNFFINELSTLVPIISYSPKKLDKTSILRLAATYIRLNNVIFGSRRDSKRSAAQDRIDSQIIEQLPQHLASFNWSENVLEEMGGMLLIVNGAGRIIFISHTVEKLLGHTQIELMGQSLYNLTCLEDYDELKRNLAPDEEFTNASSGDTGPDESSSDSSNLSTATPTRQIAQFSQIDSDKKLRRSFYIRLRQRAQSRSDQPQYELVHVIGHLRVPLRRAQPSTSHQPNQNDIVLVSVVKPFKEKRITTLSLMEACREEFITRHTLDGRIIYTDHRISIVAGYLSEEVCGIPGFQYMHKEDFRWTMVGLRQMFFRGSSYGQSCYRLLSKNGTFIYLKTCAYLELTENNDGFQSLICINSVVSPQEGDALIRQMKDQFSPVIKNKCDRNMEILSSNIDVVGNNDNKGETEDPKVLEAAITHLISNVNHVPDLSTNLHSPSPATEPQFAKATLAAKAMPPLSIHIKKIGIVPPIIKTPAAVAASLSPPSSHHSPPPKPSPPPPPTPICHQQNRPSVLRVAHKQGDHVVPPPDRVSVLKIKRMRIDESGQEVVTVTPTPRCVGVVVSPGASNGSKRKSEDSNEWSLDPISPVAQPPPPLPLDQPPPLSPPFQLGVDPVDQLLTSVDGPLFFDGASPPPLSSTHLEDIGLTDMYGLALSWGQPDVPEMLETSHRSLDSRMQLQEDQIHEIEQELEMVPQDHTSGQVINSKLTQLQEEHRKQQQMLRTLQQDHQNIQQLGVCNNQQNVGV